MLDKKVILRRKDLFNQFTSLIEARHEEITERFINDLMKNSETAAYRNCEMLAVYESSDMVYRDLSQWISREYPKKKIEERYRRLGRERMASGIPFPQVCKALVLQRRHLWLFVIDKLYDDKTAYLDALELNNRVTLYFDRAIFYMLMAYYDELTK